MTIFDMKAPIHETGENLPSISELLIELEIILMHHDIAHSFTLPTTEEIEQERAKNGKELAYWLHYTQGQNTQMTLLIALFSKKYLGTSDADLLNCVTNSIINHSVK